MSDLDEIRDVFDALDKKIDNLEWNAMYLKPDNKTFSPFSRG